MVSVTRVEKNNSSANSVNDKNAEFTATDSLGRHYVLKRPSYLKGLQLAKVLGDLAENTSYYNGVYYFTWIKSVDGIEASLDSVLEIEAMAQRLDHEGVMCIREKILEIADAAGKTKEEVEKSAQEELKVVQKHAKK